jgi:hypothetical protein
MENIGELSRCELLALKEILMKGRTIDRTFAVQLINDHLVIGSPNSYLKLTLKGRRMLVRGSPALWDIAS